MRPYPNAAKAFHQIVRQDAKNVDRYRAELKYFHVPQRVILGMTNAYTVLDETFTMGKDMLRGIAQAVQGAHQATPSDYALAPPPAPPAHPHAHTPT